ncbi:phospholipase D family protein [Halalkalibacillus halophilus]|uniref:phospholipase D family protein n=1 Tax=Halalkalibacillus halophilus TaxID=392827 RepID=UPI000412B258|nr:phospholipase D family protein [Halalkalibacillus halophilus]
MKHKWYRKKRWWILIVVITIFLVTLFYHQFKPLPEGISYAGDTHELTEGQIDFLYDLTYQSGGEEQYEHEIWDTVFETIEEAEEFLVIDMFMINESADEDRDYPKLSSTFSQKIKEQVEANPDLKVVLITDEINTTYGSHEAKHIDYLEELGVEVVYTDLTELRDPNLLYSTIWRMGIQWFGQSGEGWLPNAFGPSSPDVTARSYLKLANVKANHRKAIITENHGLILSANPHDASGFHSNIGVQVEGSIIKDLVESEKAVAAFSGGDLNAFPTDEELEKWIDTETEEDPTMQAQIVTEKQIQYAILQALAEAESGDEVWMGMFYLSDRDVIEALERAASREVTINLVLDPNQNAFGQEKVGLPNLPVAGELMQRSDDHLNIRWYNTNEEQYHSKMIYINRGEVSNVIAGSSNFTTRNLDNYNLENDISVTAPSDSEFTQEIDSYFNRLWHNEDAEFTVDYAEHQDNFSTLRYAGYLLQKWFRFTTY